MTHVRVISEKPDYAKDWISVYASKVQLPDGKIVDWYTIKLEEDAVIVIRIERNQVYLTKEWRFAWNRYLVTPPVGGVRRNTTERQRLAQARKELRQETGFDARTIKKLGKVFLSARISQTCHVYLVTNLFKSELPRDAGEYTESVKAPFEKAFRMFLSGELPTTSYCISAFALIRESRILGPAVLERLE